MDGQDGDVLPKEKGYLFQQAVASKNCDRWKATTSNDLA